MFINPLLKVTPHYMLSRTILASSNNLADDLRIQEDKIVLCKLVQYIPIIYNHQGEQHGLLTSTSTASILAQNISTTGSFHMPALNDIIINDDNFIRHIKSTEADPLFNNASDILSMSQYENLSDELSKILNRD
ncbi:hypothetical protein INT48_001466 [Thamnidium elegans]|uniref:Uncharacterized protein n=1 Tax=Thamnidium elegans TaxID=101142 RepID=A0A8H7SJH2_9FUNG|nr:hypothetical protein INT48_001466 [Thamnidium elegans]